MKIISAFILAAIHWHIAFHYKNENFFYHKMIIVSNYIAAIIWSVNGIVNIFSTLY